MKKQIRIGVGDTAGTAKGFIEAWRRAESREKLEVEQRLYFENLETLLKTLTTGRWVLLKKLRTSGPLSVRALAKELGRDYKNVHTDIRRLERMGLIVRSKDNKIEVPWDIVEAELRLAA
ncbi:MAG: MarR family transcriptional regulator [Deltaproteobacteria bacterium]|nr:MarR family transcriptional regulator [Deltaproteobacteria bacterium]